MSKNYILEQIERVRTIIKVGTKYRYDELLINYEHKHFGYNNKLNKFKKQELAEYLEELVKRAYELNLLDNTFVY